MRVFEQDIFKNDCIREPSCLYDKRILEYHQRGVTGNCWKEVASKAGLANGKISFVFFQTLFLHKMTRSHRRNIMAML